MTGKSVILSTPLARRTAAEYLRDAQDGTVVTFKPATRSLLQNGHFHAICTALAKSDVQWMGKRRTKIGWKNLLISGHAIATMQETENTVGLEGELVSIRESSAQMSVARGSSLIEYSLAFCADKGVTPVYATEPRVLETESEG